MKKKIVIGVLVAAVGLALSTLDDTRYVAGYIRLVVGAGILLNFRNVLGARKLTTFMRELAQTTEGRVRLIVVACFLALIGLFFISSNSSCEIVTPPNIH